MRRFLFLAFPVVCVAGCGSGGSDYRPTPSKPVEPATLTAGDEKSLFPMAVGNQWTYVATTQQRSGNQSGGGEMELTMKVVKVTPTADGEIADIEVTTSNGNGKKDLQRWERNSKGIFQTAVGNPLVPYNPPQPVLLFPTTAGRRFSWKGSGMTAIGKSGTSDSNSEILSVQEAFGQSERYSAIAVQSRGTFASGTTKGEVANTAFFAPKVGLVRYRQEVVIGQNAAVNTLALKAKTVQ